MNNIIEANREAAAKIEREEQVELSPEPAEVPRTSESPEPVTSEIEREIESIPKIADEIRSSIEDVSKNVLEKAPQITKTDVQACSQISTKVNDRPVGHLIESYSVEDN